jgi:hypothetical protein
MGPSEEEAPPAAVAAEPTATTGPSADAWQGLVNAGMAFLSRLAEVATLPAEGKPPTLEQPFSLETEPGSGRRYLRLPVPDPQALAQLAGALGGLLERLNER